MERRRVHRKRFDRGQRAVVVFVGLAFGVIGIRLPAFPDAPAPFVDQLWPVVFGAASILCLAYAIRPSSRALWLLSGLFCVVAAFSRAVGVLVGQVAGAVALTSPQAHVGFAVWSTVSVLVWAVWQKLFGPTTAVLGQFREERT